MTGDECKIIGSLTDFYYAADNTELILSHMASPKCKIVSLTITEKGYHTDETTGALDKDHEQVK